MPDLSIRLRLDRSHAEQAAQQEIRSVGRMRDAYGRFVKETDGEVRRTADGMRRVGDEGRAGFGAAGAAAGSAAGLVKGFGAQMLGLVGLDSILSGLAEEFRRVQKAAEDAGKEVTRDRGDVRGLAALKGEAGQTGKTMTDLFAFRRETFQTQEEAIAFQLAALGAGEAAIGKQITQSEFDDLMRRTGQFGTMIGADTDSMGTLAGMMPILMGKERTTGGESFQMVRQFQKIFQPGGAEFGPQVDMLLKGANLSTSGMFKDIRDQAALQSFFSVYNKEAAGELVQQFTRATVGGLGRGRSPGLLGDIMPGEDPMKQGAYLAGIGATAEMDPIAIGRRIAADLKAKQGEYAGKGKEFNAYAYLRSMGYGNQEDIGSILTFMGGLREFETTFMPSAAPGAMPSLDAAMADMRGMKDDPFFLQRQAMLAEDAATFQQGAYGPEYVEQLRRQMFAKMVASGEAVGKYEDYTGGMMGWDRQQDIDYRISRHLNDQLPPGQRDQSMNWKFRMFDSAGRAEDLAGLVGKVRAAGGEVGIDPGRNIEGAAMREAADGISTLVKHEERKQSKPVLLPLPPPLGKPKAPQAGAAR